MIVALSGNGHLNCHRRSCQRPAQVPLRDYPRPQPRHASENDHMPLYTSIGTSPSRQPPDALALHEPKDALERSPGFVALP